MQQGDRLIVWAGGLLVPGGYAAGGSGVDLESALGNQFAYRGRKLFGLVFEEP